MSKKTKQQKHQERLEAKEHHQVELAERHAHDHEDEFVVAPKGMSRRRFLFTLGITIFVVLAFVVPGAIIGTMGGAGRGEHEYVTWRGPNGEARAMTGREFGTFKREYNSLLDSLDPRHQTVSDEDTAAHVVEDELARAAGIVVTDAELVAILKDQFGLTSDSLAQVARRYRLTPTQYQEQLRSFLRVNRYRGLMSLALQFPDTSEVEQRWRDQFREYEFEYAVAAAEDYEDAARAALPADAELQAWFDGLPQFRKNTFMTQRRMGGEFVVLPLASDAPAALLEKYPLAEDADLDALARNYYDFALATRFTPPAPAEGEEPAEAPSFEDVAESCRAEAPVYSALRSWLNELAPIANDPEQELDLAAKAQEVGLEVVSDGTLRTQAEWEELPVYGNDRLGGMLRFAVEGGLLPAVIVSDQAMVVGRCTKVENPRMPEFAEIKDDVADAWVQEERANFALKKLEEVHAAFVEDPENVPAIGGIDVEQQAFADAVAAAGLEVQVRAWRNKVLPPEGGYEDAPPIENFLRQNSVVFVMKDGQVGEPALDVARENAFLIRMAGSRDPELIEMRPAYVRNIENTLVNQGATAFAGQAFGFTALQESQGLALHPLEQEQDAQ